MQQMYFGRRLDKHFFVLVSMVKSIRVNSSDVLCVCELERESVP